MKLLFLIFSSLLLIYMALPGPTSINSFRPLPNSVKSTLEGDTIHVPNVAGYFSGNYRQSVLGYYTENYQQKTLFPFPPLRLNYPPEYAFKYVKDQTQATYLEERYYPFRDSLFINGLEPFNEDGTPRFPGAIPFEIEGSEHQTKVTIRYYPSPLWARLLTWLGITVAIIGLYKVGRKVIND